MEYPKALYPGGTFDDTRDENGLVPDSRVVQSAEEEEAAKAEGYFAFGAAPADWSPVATELDRLKAEAEARGIQVKGTWGVRKLREVLA